MARVFLTVVGAALLTVSGIRSEGGKPIKILFLGDNGHHRPMERFKQLQPVLAQRGIDLTYTDKTDALNPKTLASYDGLLVYANTTRITPEQEKALVDFVEGGKGFIPLHCASYCFLNSPKYIDLVGAQFKSHGTGTFRTTIAEPNHPVMKGFKGFESWDETYVHTKHNEKDRTVLEYRADGNVKEPWTWVRTQGQGRVFYTAWGHDQRTWSNPGFQALVERGIRWATGNDPAVVAPAKAQETFSASFPVPQMTPQRKDAKPFEFVDVGKKIPNYTRSARWGVQGEPFSKMQMPLSPEESLKHLVVPKGFHVELFASEKELGDGKPICMNWDERGRLWVAMTFDYPNNLQPEGQGHDRIVVCEDTHGTGHADKVTVFAENLSIPTSMMFSHGGLIVFNSGKTIYLKDTDGDGKADERKLLFGTWNMRDTHGTASNMQYGLDNWIWAMQGYNDSFVSVGGESHRFRQGFFRFRPDASKLEFIRSTDNNTWGLGISEEGLIFGSTANRNPSVYMPIPNRYYEAVRGWAPSLMLHTIADTYLFKPITDKVRQVDQFGGYTAGAGHSLYTARRYPQEYWNHTAFVSDPTGHLTGTFVLRREGTSFRSNNMFNLVASDDEWTAPIMAEVGPDGNVWVIDWYNFIVQHNPTPAGFRTGKGAAYETDLRDKKHARIYRIVYDGPGASQPAPFTLAGASPRKLVQTLANDNLFWRRHAQRLLVERGKLDVLPDLMALAKDTHTDPLGLNVGAIHALWTMHGLGTLDGSHPEATAVAYVALRHPSAGVRRNAVQVLPRDEQSVAAILDAGLTRDPEPLVRLQTLLALADQPATPAVGNAIVAMMSDSANASDRWIPDAATCAAAKNSDSFLRAVAACRQPATPVLNLISIVADHYARGGPSATVTDVMDKLVQADPSVVEAVVRGLSRGWPTGTAPSLTPRLEKALSALAKNMPRDRQGLLINLASSWGSKDLAQLAAEASKSLLALVKDEARNADDRIAAARELVGLRVKDRPTVQALLELITPRTTPELADGFFDALQRTEVAEAGKLIIERLAGVTPASRKAGLRVLLSRPDWTRALLESASRGQVQLADLTLDQKQRLSDHPNPGIQRRARDLLSRGGALPNPDRQKVVDEFMPITKIKGDATAGKLVYKDTCSKCHVHGSEGTRIGPDLTGMAVHPKDHLLIDILDPSRSVEGNFRAYTVVTKKGQVLTGLLASESKTAVELFDAEAKKQTILRTDIDELVASTKSLMPDGFEKQLSRQQLTDLLEFLTERGKYLPLPLEKVATAVSTRGMFISAEAVVERLVFDDWKPQTIDGIPFQLVDPRGDRVPNVILLYGPQGSMPPKMPKTISLPCNVPAKAIHLLSGVSGWGFPYGTKGSVSLIVRLHYADGKTEDHELKNGEQFADYIRRVDVPGSKFAFNLHGRQIRYLAVRPQRTAAIERIEFVKGPDDTAPVIMAVTIEAPG